MASASPPSPPSDPSNVPVPPRVEHASESKKDLVLSCDYLVVGGGAMGLAFVDSLLLLQPDASVVLVDKHPAPGGHWNDDYEYVMLHQPSLVYGVESSQLEGNRLKLLIKGQLPPWHRANKGEILRYYKEVVDKHVSTGNLQYFPHSSYDLDQTPEVVKDDEGGDNVAIHSFRSLPDDSGGGDIPSPSVADIEGPWHRHYRVRVKVMAVDAVQGEVQIPATTPPLFDVEDKSSIRVVTPNELHEMHNQKRDSTEGSGSAWWKPAGGIFRPVAKWFASTEAASSAPVATKYVVLGCGKTGMDAVVHLLNELRVKPEDVAWVIPRDVWVINRARGGPSAYHQELLEQTGNHEKAMDSLEAKKVVYRLDPDVRPTAPFRFPTVSGAEVKVLRSVTNKIRQGRVQSISVVDHQHPRLVFEDGSDLVLRDANIRDTVFVHCTAPGPFNGRTIDSIYSEVGVAGGGGTSLKMTLFPLLPPPIPLSGAMLARIETSRRYGTCDLVLGQACLGTQNPSPPLDPATAPSPTPSRAGGGGAAAVWKEMIRPYIFASPDPKAHLDVHWNLAAFLALLDKDPAVGANWLSKGNRLSIYTWIEKLQAHENVHLMVGQAGPIGYSDGEVRTLQLLADKLAPLKGR
jgi:hypothetical protein